MNTIEQKQKPADYKQGLKVERTFRGTILFSLYAAIKSCVYTNIKKKVFQLALLLLSANTKKNNARQKK